MVEAAPANGASTKPEPIAGLTRFWLLCALLPSLGLAALLLFDTHVQDPPTVWAFVLARVLQVAAVAGFVAVPVFLLAGEPSASRACWVAVVSGSAIALSVLGAGFRSPADSTALRAAAAALVGAVLAGVWLWRHLPRPAELPKVAVVAAAIGASLIPGMQLLNATSFTVARSNVSMSFGVDVQNDGIAADGRNRLVRVEVTTTNEAPVRALVVKSEAKVCWAALDRPLPAETSTVDCAWSEPIGDRKWVDAGTDVVGSQAVLVPTEAQHVVVYVRANYVRGDRVVLAPTNRSRVAPPLGTHVTAYQILDESNFRELAQQTKYLVYIDDGGISFTFATYAELADLRSRAAGPSCEPAKLTDDVRAQLRSEWPDFAGAPHMIRCELDDPAHIAEYVGMAQSGVRYETWLTDGPAARPSEAPTVAP